MTVRIDEDIKTALKNGRKSELQTLRMLKSALSNARIAKKAELDEADFVKVLQKEAKQRKESIDSFAAAGRVEQAEKERQELEVIMRYLPETLSDEELDSLIADAIAESGATDERGLGQVMKVLQPKVAGRADGKEVASKVRRQLQQL